MENIKEITVGDVKRLIGLRSAYYYKGAMTGKTLWRSWVNRPTDKYDNELVCSIWAEPVIHGEGCSKYTRAAIGIYIPEK